MYIEDIASVYEEEGLNFHTDEEKQCILLKMSTKVSPDVQFIARIVNSRTVLFETRLPMNVPEKNREAVSSYLTRANFGLLVGGFQMDFSDGELKYTVAGCHDEDEPLSDDVLLRLTYVGFNMFDNYMPGVFAIIYGNKDPAEIYEEIEGALQARREQMEQDEEDDDDDDGDGAEHSDKGASEIVEKITGLLQARLEQKMQEKDNDDDNDDDEKAEEEKNWR